MKNEAGGSSDIDEEECLRRALGGRRGWQRGFGRKVKNLVADIASTYSKDPNEEFSEHLMEINRRLDGLEGQSKSKGKRPMEEEDEDNDEDVDDGEREGDDE